MKTIHKVIAAIASLVILVSSVMVIFLMLNMTTGRSSVQSSGTGSSGVTPESVQTVSADMTTHSAVEISEEEKETAFQQVTQVSLPTAKGYNAMQTGKGKESLTESSLQTLYEKMEKAAYQVSEAANESGLYPAERITVRGYELTDIEIVQVLSAFLHDHPEVYWLSNQYGYSIGNSRTSVQLYSVISPAECNKLSKRMVSEISLILQSIPENVDALDREIYLYQTLIARCEYDDAAVSDDSDWRAHSVVGVLLDGSAVCEGYARALQLLLCQSGIPSMVITGTAGGAHMWNLARIDGQWYHLDVTWDDNGELPAYRYLNLTDKMIQEDHTIYPQAGTDESRSAQEIYNLPLPSCTSEKANYFRAKGVKIDSLENSQSLTSALREASNNQAPCLPLYISEELSYGETVKQLFQASPYQFLYSVQQVNERTENPINYNHCTYIEAEMSRGLLVLLEYE